MNLKTCAGGLLAGLLAIGSGTAAEQDDDTIAVEELPDAVRCVPLRSIRNTDIVDDRNILFYMRDGRIYLNRLTHRCPGLRVADSFMYRTSLSQLCNVDIITVLNNLGFGFLPGASCGLGMFRPITADMVVALKEKPVSPEPEATEPELETGDAADESGRDE